MAVKLKCFLLPEHSVTPTFFLKDSLISSRLEELLNLKVESYLICSINKLREDFFNNQNFIKIVFKMHLCSCIAFISVYIPFRLSLLLSNLGKALNYFTISSSDFFFSKLCEPKTLFNVVPDWIYIWYITFHVFLEVDVGVGHLTFISTDVIVTATYTAKSVFWPFGTFLSTSCIYLISTQKSFHKWIVIWHCCCWCMWAVHLF